jgi:HK97 family phage portal protein
MNLLQKIAKSFSFKGTEPVGTGHLDANSISRQFFYFNSFNHHGSLSDIGKNDSDFIRYAFQYNDIVFAVADYIASVAAGVKWLLVKDVDGKPVKLEGPAATAARRLLEMPNEHQTWQEFCKLEVLYNIICSKSIILKLRQLTGKKSVYELHNVSPANCNILYDNEFFKTIRSITITHAGAAGLLRPDAKDVIIRYNPDLSGRADGLSKLAPASRTILRSNNAKTAANELFKNGGAYGIVGVEDENITEDGIINIEKKYRDKHTGVSNHGKIVFTNGKIKFERIGMTAVDLELSKQHVNDLRAICAVFGAPSQLFGDSESSTFANYETARKALITNVVLPHLENLYAKLSWCLLPELSASLADAYLIPDVSKIPELQADLAKQTEALSKADWMTIDEKRAYMGLPEMQIPETQTLWINNLPIEQAYEMGNQVEG